ncbi:hypothetical protein GCM10011487_56870 [Steroidobacter agaridevorans]|uniref:Uncharacterized protein n=1 Tax=Steroidobacter agaridevorans TaxID=2695856 RepID=A0A829YK11_9GAMM|nr:hypothetical protein GCM10011487_56870 [Steroidobacter agaridevorans]
MRIVDGIAQTHACLSHIADHSDHIYGAIDLSGRVQCKQRADEVSTKEARGTGH